MDPKTKKKTTSPAHLLRAQVGQQLGMWVPSHLPRLAPTYLGEHLTLHIFEEKVERVSPKVCGIDAARRAESIGTIFRVGREKNLG